MPSRTTAHVPTPDTRDLRARTGIARHPLAHAVAMLLLATNAQAQQAFSPAWFANKGAVQNAAAATGQLPNGVPAASLTGPRQQSQAARERLKQSIDNLATSAQAIAAQQALQRNARAAAAGSGVPDGLGEGGLEVDDNALTRGWLNARAPTQGIANGTTTVTIEQTGAKAVLNWETFNVGRNTLVDFNQQADWAALNRVNDPLARPSQIQGRISAEGTVLIVNRNGVMFGGTSQVNTRNLVAAAAEFSDEQFLQRGLYSAQQNTAPAASFTDAAGKVIVEAGARIETAASNDVRQGGGYVLLLGSEVHNAGSITTSRGQTLLAAGDEFVIRKGVGTEANTFSTTRGNEVLARRDEDSATGEVRNTGLITAREGDITLTGHRVRQDGVAVSTTTVNQRGTIHLSTPASDAEGEVVLGADAVTAVLIEDDGRTTALDSQRDALIAESQKQDALRFVAGQAGMGGFDNLSSLSDRRDQSRVEIVSGGDVRFEADSLTVATGGQIAVSAKDRVFAADKATLDVAGAVGVQVAMESNNVQVNVQGNELRDSPVNRDSGDLFNQNVWIDRRDLVHVPAGTGGYDGDRWYAAGGLLEVGGWLSNQGHGIGEWAAQGGSIVLGGNEVVTQRGSSINLSGGALDVQTGYAYQTWLRGADGRLYSLDEASANMRFAGVYNGFEDTHERWGENLTGYYYNPLIAPQRRLENGYTVGRDAGRLTVSAPTAVLEGGIVATVFDGEQQGRVRDDIADGYRQAQTAVAKAGTLVYGRANAVGTGAFDTHVSIGEVANIADAWTGAEDLIPEERVGTLHLDAARLGGAELGGLDITTSADIVIDGALRLADGGELRLNAADTRIDADVTARGGAIGIGNTAPVRTVTGGALEDHILLDDDGTASFALGEGATLDLRGIWTNDVPDANPWVSTAHVDGGDLTVRMFQGSIALGSGSVVDVSSGATLAASGDLLGGRGGDVRLLAGMERSTLLRNPDGVRLQLDGELRAQGVLGGGTLELQSPQDIAFGHATPDDDTTAMQLDAALLRSGFSAYSITSLGKVSVAGTELRADMPVLHLPANATPPETGADPRVALESWTPPLYQEDPVNARMSQREGASVTLRGAAIEVDADSRIEVDPGQRVRLAASGQITVDGDITAPGGDIAILSEPVGFDVPEMTGTSLWIGADAVLDAAGRAQVALDQNGRRYGTVQDGGSIRIGLEGYDRRTNDRLDATNAFVVIREGAKLDASGAAADLDVYAGQGPFHASRVVNVAGDGGLIRLGSTRGILNDGDLRAAAGGAGASGGELGVVLENAPGLDGPMNTLTVTQQRVASGLAVGLEAGVSDPTLADSQARISAGEIAAGGFDTLDLWSRDVIAFDGDVNLQLGRALHLRRAAIGVADGDPDARVRLSAPYVLLEGKSNVPLTSSGLFTPSGMLVPSNGNAFEMLATASRNTGSLDIDADLIDVRDFVSFGASGTVYETQATSSARPVELIGFDSIDLTSRGDMRFLGARVAGSNRDLGSRLNTGGDMTITAAQLYPGTHASGTVQVGRKPDGTYDMERTLTIRGYGSTPAMPQSVFGALTLAAPNIDQGGVVRAPLGRITFNQQPFIDGFRQEEVYDVTLRAGSITSTSAAGLTMPYGGTVDGLRYLYDGQEVTFREQADIAGGDLQDGIVFGHARLTAESGALIDVSGGGELLGAGFVSGRGGSVDVLRTPLANANPANAFSSADAQVYAIVPGMHNAPAPVSPDAGAGQPGIGRQITLTEAVGDLAPGTYTLMPSNYALLPGAYRVELGSTMSGLVPPAVGLPAGSISASGYLGVANTDIRDALPTSITLTSGEAVRSHSQYNETRYAKFAIDDAKRFGALRPRLERDAQSVQIDFGKATGDVLDFDGLANLQGAEGGLSGNLFVTGGQDIEIKARGAQATDGMASFDAEDLSAFGAGAMVVGGLFGLVQGQDPDDGNAPNGPRILFRADPNDIVVRDGATLKAGQLFLTGKDVVVQSGAVLDTTAHAADSVIDSSLGLLFHATRDDRTSRTGAILAVSDGFLDFAAPLRDAARPNSITVEDGATLRTDGTIAFASGGEVTVGEADLGARDLQLAAPRVNIGTTESFAAADAASAIGAGVRLSQSTLERLLGASEPGSIAIERLRLTVGESLNFFGNVDFNLREAGGDAGAQLVLNSPAIYGWGGADDVARITADTLVWSGLGRGRGTAGSPYENTPPGAVMPGGAGTGAGRLEVDAREIVFGYDELARPQDQVELDRLALGFASVDLNASERIAANQRGSLSVYRSGTDEASYTGGALNLSTPLLTGDAGSSMRYATGGALTVSSPTSAAIDTRATDALGAEVRLDGATVSVDAAVVLPSGRLVVDADDGIVLGDRANLDLSGRTLRFFDVTRTSWGGDVVMETANGAIVQDAGSRIDVSATGNDAGSIQATATGAGGDVAFGGTLLGRADAGFDSGAFDVRATRLDDFAGLNAKLDAGGFFHARGFVIKTGDLVVRDDVRANEVSISIDGGSLTVDGTIDASGAEVGRIRLAARDTLALTGNAVLDVHGTQLVTDAYGQAIDASNRGAIELTSRDGNVSLASSARLDLRSADGVARGHVDINAPRIGGNDVAVDAANDAAIDGAASIAVNAFARYTPADGIVSQTWLDAIHLDSVAFIDAAGANAAVDARLSGLKSYGAAFHLRPGVEIVSDGDLTVRADLDLSGYRYGPDADGAVPGSGEPGVLTIRAGGDLDINGSISDGFAPPPATPDDNAWQVRTELLNGQAAPAGMVFDIPFNPEWGDQFYAFPNLAEVQVVSGSVTDWFGSYFPGDIIPGLLYGQVIIEAGTVLTSANPSDADIVISTPRPEPGRLWAAAPMLDPGMQSWSMRLVGGADTQSADSRSLAAASRLNGSGNVVLKDEHKMGPDADRVGLSVVRTGTGSLDVLAGGDYRQETLYGVYTAGTQVADGAGWNAPRATRADGTVLGAENAGYEASLGAQRMFFADGGGDLLLAAQGDVRGLNESFGGNAATDDIGRWLWRQGGDELDQRTAWGINFGQYRWWEERGTVELVGFSGIGTLGGGNVTVRAGGDAGASVRTDISTLTNQYTVDTLNLVVAGSGRVDADGRLVQTGGGSLDVDVGGRMNTRLNDTDTGNDRPNGGLVLNLRGDIDVRAGSIGRTMESGYGLIAADDPRASDLREPLNRIAYSPLDVVVGDGVASLRSRGDLNIGSGTDAGRVTVNGGATQAEAGGLSGSAIASFSLWTDRSAIDLFATGGDVHQTPKPGSGLFAVYDPARFTAVAANGSIVLDGLTLAPSASGDLQLFARDHVLGSASMSGATPTSTNAPLRVFWGLAETPESETFLTSNAILVGDTYFRSEGAGLFTFGLDTASNLHAGAGQPARIYALEGDVRARTGGVGTATVNGDETRPVYLGATSMAIRAGRDVLASGLIVNNDADDVSVVQAGRDILNTSIDVAGPGLLEVTAGRNVYQALDGTTDATDSAINSLGAIVAGDTRPGAGIVLSAGMGQGGPDYAAFAALYLDPANLADPEQRLADQPGKVAKTYEKELADWLAERFDYAGDDALAYFDTLPPTQQGVFLREVYFAELRLSGREFNDPDSRRFESYLRGRNAIAVLFPEKDANGNVIAREGSISFQGAAGVHTRFGGDLQVLAPGGALTLGVDGVAPPPGTGLVTLGEGDIDIFTGDDVLLGLSRIMTTLGGGITAWSVEGDINAGRGSKTALVYTPPRMVYDDVGNLSLSPNVPSTGAGIATLDPIPGTEPGDVDLIAPLGTIDVGEAGIRVSGNVNFAALQVGNAANVQVKGEATGLPPTTVVNTAALTSASAAANSATQAVQDMTRQQQDAARRAQPSIISVQVLGFGPESSRVDAPQSGTLRAARPAGYDASSAFQVLGNGELTAEQQSRLTTAERRRLQEPE